MLILIGNVLFSKPRNISHTLFNTVYKIESSMATRFTKIVERPPFK